MSKKIFDTIEQSLAKPKRFNQTETGTLRLSRSIIPKNMRAHLSIHLDLDTAMRFTSISTDLGVTADELMRELIWCLVDEYHENQ